MRSRDGTARCGAVQFGLKMPANSPTYVVLVQLLLARALELFLLAFACLFSSLSHDRRLFFPLVLLTNAVFSAAASSVPAKAGASLRFDFARVIALGATAVSAARLPGRASAILFYLLLLQGRVCCVERLIFLLAEREADLGVDDRRPWRGRGRSCGSVARGGASTIAPPFSQRSRHIDLRSTRAPSNRCRQASSSEKKTLT